MAGRVSHAVRDASRSRFDSISVQGLARARRRRENRVPRTSPDKDALDCSASSACLAQPRSRIIDVVSVRGAIAYTRAMIETWLIIGGGSAGGVLAARLSENPHRNVVLVEKGPDHAAELPAYARFAFMASSKEAPDCPAASAGELMVQAVEAMTWYPTTAARRPSAAPRGEMIGGSSQVNAGIYLWGTPADYDEWAALGNPGWSYRDVQPSFAALETDTDHPAHPHGTAGPVIGRPFTSGG